jgi:hypothetical protein
MRIGSSPYFAGSGALGTSFALTGCRMHYRKLTIATCLSIESLRMTIKGRLRGAS